MPVIVQCLKLQADRVVSEGMEHSQDRIAMTAKDVDDLTKIRSLKAPKKPSGDRYDSSSSDEAR